MSRKNISQFNRLQALTLACLLGALSSCASKGVNGDTDAPSLPVSEASLLSDSEKTDANADSSVFADLNPGKDSAGATPVADAAAGPFYSAIGGESLGRVAYTLYGDRSFKKQLSEKNAGLPKRIPAGQPVYFDFSDVKPQAMYLTKDLLDRYPNELSDKLKAASSNPAAAGTVTLQPGETLQKVSERLYGTTRYWTELYLLNHDKISHYDKVHAGMTLATIDHGKTAPIAESTPIPVAEPISEPVPQLNTQAAPVTQPAMDPIPETPEVEAPTPAPSAVTPIPQAPMNTLANQPVASGSIIDKIGDSSNANLRRIVYVLLIVGIGGLAFYFTRPTRKSKIDMLDVTAGSTAPPPPRSRLSTKETTRKTVG